MAACSLFEEDEVCHVTPENTYIYGLVMENSETVSSDEEDARHDFCKKGCVRVAWHPKGKESYNTPENKVLLADRSLVVADVVRRLVPGQETQCGGVQDIQVTCHLHITGTDKYIYNVDSKLLSSCVQLQKYDNGYVTLDNWLGRVEDVSENITLKLSDGARCEMDDSQICFLEDVSEKRPESVTYNEEYWYPGQQLKGIMGNLVNANWLNTSLLYNGRTVDTKRNSTFYAIVEKVEISRISVYWICRGYSKAILSRTNNLDPPPRELEGNDIERLQIVDWFDHCAVKLGDKMYYTIREEDVLETQLPKHRFTPHCTQVASSQQVSSATHTTEDLYHQRFEDGVRPRRKAGRKTVTNSMSTSSSNATAVSVASSPSTASNKTLQEAGSKATHDAAPTPTATSKSLQEAANAGSAVDLETPGQQAKGAGDLDLDPESEADADDEYEDVDEDREGGSGSDVESVGSSASGAKRRKRDRGCLGLSVKSLRNASRHARRTRPVPDIKLVPGSRVATEVCYTFSRVTVMWQDGTMEEKIPSVELFPIHHVDDLEFFPGSFVIDASSADTSNEYGVVTSCNHFERTCQVKWLKAYEVGHATCPTEVIKESEVSVYDIQDHPDYKFRPGHSVIRVSGFGDAQQTLQAVGQVIRIDQSGKVLVHWTNGTYTSVYPQELYIVWDMSDYSNSSMDSFETSSSEEDSVSDASWETEEEEEDWKVDGDVDGILTEEEEDQGILSSLKDLPRVEVRDMLGRMQSFFTAVGRLYARLSRASPNMMPSMLGGDARLTGCLKKVLKVFQQCRKLDRSLRTAYFSGPDVLELVASIKLDLKMDRTNKIKQHLEHVFESSNRGLLDLSKGDDKERAEDGEDHAPATPDLQGTRVDEMSLESTQPAPAAGIASPRKKVGTEDAEETGTPVDADVGSSVDSRRCGSSSPPKENGVLGGNPQDVERDIANRLAAANVDESKDAAASVSSSAAAVVAPPDEGTALVADAGHKGSGAPRSEDGGSSPVDDQSNLVGQMCGEMEESLESIHHCLERIHTLLKASHRRSSASLWKGAVDNTASPVDKVKDVAMETDKVALEDKKEGVGLDMDVDGNVDGEKAVEEQAVNGKEEEPEEEPEEEEAPVDPPGMAPPSPHGFSMCSEAPECHCFSAKSCLPSNMKSFNTAVRKELKLLRSSLPNGIMVKGFENRMDLFSVLIDGPSSTPYEDCVFLFDVMLPHDYPSSPPFFHFLSYSTERLNPNLYTDGKVCVSLLGTWSGKGMEVWTNQSNLLQVLVSIQGLILNDEPYYNEAGYEKQRGQQIAEENSRLYNEMALLRVVESMSGLCRDPPRPFQQEVKERLLSNGPRFLERLRRWLSLSERPQGVPTSPAASEGGAVGGVAASEGGVVGGVTPPSSNGTAEHPAQDSATAEEMGVREPAPAGHPQFPLLPMSKGFRLTLHKSLSQLEAALDTLRQPQPPTEDHSQPQHLQSDDTQVNGS